MTTPAEVTHLWRRAAFWISADDADDRAGRPWDELVAELVDPEAAPMSRPAALDDPALDGPGEFWRTLVVAGDWLDHMAATPTPGAEKLCWFWHNHFTTSLNKVMWGEGMHRQLGILRSRGQGPFRDLLGDIVVDSAMCLYLDNVNNVAGGLNENFARELLELFTVGVGNHTQADVLDVARSLTGHNIDWSGPLVPRFYPELHDAGTKTVLGHTGAFNARGLCDVLCAGVPGQLVARRVARRLWSAWGYPQPSEALVEDLGERALADGFSGRAFARAVLLHPEFLGPRARTEGVRSPVEVGIALAKTTGVSPSGLGVGQAVARAGHYPYLPPTVEGWPAARSLLSPAAWWALGDLHVVAAFTAVQAAPTTLPATSGLDPTAAARSILRWAGIVDPAAETVAGIASYLATVRAAQPDSEAMALVLSATLSPDFAAGGGS